MSAARSPSPVTGLVMVILTLLGWSSIPLFLKHFTPLIDGFTANGWRYSLAAILWAPALALAAFRGSLPRSLWLAAIIPSLFNAAGQACFAVAPYHVGPGLMTFALRMQIVFVTAGAALLFASERRIIRTPGFLAGVALVILGTSGTILFKEGGLRAAAHPAAPGGNELFGIALSITSGLFYACYSLSVRHFMRGVNPLTAFAVISQYTALALIPPMLIWGAPGVTHLWHGAKVLDLPGRELLFLALSSIIGIGLGHTFYYVSIERLGVAVSSGVIQLQPILVSIASFFLFQERMTAIQWTCGALAITGAGVILYTQHRLSRPTHPSWACQRCGYDLRGLVGGVACPECGTTEAADLGEFATLPIDADVAAATAEPDLKSEI
jgi:drug/metabolite transporter (DMT)-like permease